MHSAKILISKTYKEWWEKTSQLGHAAERLHSWPLFLFHLWKLAKHNWRYSTDLTILLKKHRKYIKSVLSQVVPRSSVSNAKYKVKARSLKYSASSHRTYSLSQGRQFAVLPGGTVSHWTQPSALALTHSKGQVLHHQCEKSALKRVWSICF